MVGIAITRTELTASELRTAAGRTKDARAARRMLAISLVLEGADRTTAAETCGMDRQTLRDRVHRYNAEGLAGLVNRTVPPRPRRLVPDQVAALAALVKADPDPVRDGVVRGRRTDSQHRIAAVIGVVLHERICSCWCAPAIFSITYPFLKLLIITTRCLSKELSADFMRRL